MVDYKQFLKYIIFEALHPELQTIVQAPTSPRSVSKKTQLANKIRELTERGEKTGIEGNMPSGSSRAYLKHDEDHNIVVDGKPTTIPTGMKIAIKSPLDRYHDRVSNDGMSLGQMQMKAENGDYYVDKAHRVLTEDNGQYYTNDEGIFPPLIDHDDNNHEWSHVGHVDKITGPQFKKLTKLPDYPKGITHSDFYETLERFHNRNNGRYWKQSKSREDELDHIEKHPLVQNFIEYHGNTGNPPHDYRQLGNLGKWKHPITGKEYIVARDSGFSGDVAEAYKKARQKQYGRV